jgi:hypothetical protein
MSYAAFLRERDMVFTMPDKTSTPIPFMKECDADFLKRKSVFNPDLKLWMGALDEKSIFKSLCAIRDPDRTKGQTLGNTMREACINNMDGAAREWFLHGRETFEHRQKQLLEIAEKHAYPVKGQTFAKSYDWFTRKYCNRYSLPDPTQGLEIEDDVSVEEEFFVALVGENEGFDVMETR